jgi:hypothetical protein
VGLLIRYFVLIKVSVVTNSMDGLGHILKSHYEKKFH